MVKPSREFLDQLLTVAHIDGTPFVGGKLRRYTFETSPAPPSAGFPYSAYPATTAWEAVDSQ